MRGITPVRHTERSELRGEAGGGSLTHQGISTIQNVVQPSKDPLHTTKQCSGKILEAWDEN
jgi:hypothetical protein